jgi:hypothetical protein
MVCTPIFSFFALEKYLEPATSCHPIKVEGMRIARISYPWSESWILLEVWMKIHTSIYKILRRFVPPSWYQEWIMRHLSGRTSILTNGMGKVVVQAPYQQLSWQLGYLKRLVLFCLLPVVQDYWSSQWGSWFCSEGRREVGNSLVQI